jgi:hypothetical protein
MAVDLAGNEAHAFINAFLEIPASASSLNLVPSSTKFGKPGKVVNFECWVSNYGQNSDTIVINISTQHGWKFDFQVSEKGVKLNERQLSFSLAPKEFGNFTLKVTIPKNPSLLEESVIIKAVSTTSPTFIRTSTMYVKTELPITSSGINWYVVTGILVGIIAIVIICSGMILMNKMANVNDDDASYSTNKKVEKRGIFSFLAKEKGTDKQIQPQIPAQTQTTFRSYDTSYERSISYGEVSAVQSVSMGSGEYTPYYADATGSFQANFQPNIQTNLQTSSQSNTQVTASTSSQILTQQPLSTSIQNTQPTSQPIIHETDKQKRKIPMRAVEPKSSTTKPKIVEPKFEK